MITQDNIKLCIVDVLTANYQMVDIESILWDCGRILDRGQALTGVARFILVHPLV